MPSEVCVGVCAGTATAETSWCCVRNVTLADTKPTELLISPSKPAREATAAAGVAIATAKAAAEQALIAREQATAAAKQAAVLAETHKLAAENAAKDAEFSEMKASLKAGAAEAAAKEAKQKCVCNVVCNMGVAV